MPSKKRSRRSEPKVFQCKGFGNCNMVFTRSEHLARHARKHTGEKPFKCIIPGCDRMFSRFDNMMQHTHTHNRQKKRSSVGSAAPTSIVAAPPAPTHDNDNNIMLQSRTRPLPPETPEEQHYDHYPMFASPPTPFPVLPQPWQQSQYQHPTATPPVLLPPLSLTPLPVHYHMSDIDFYQGNRKSLHIQQSEMPQHLSEPIDESKKSRRLSLVDLQTPIDHLMENSADEESDDTSTVEVTSDEYEAILGFGRFHAQSLS